MSSSDRMEDLIVPPDKPFENPDSIILFSSLQKQGLAFLRVLDQGTAKMEDIAKTVEGISKTNFQEHELLTDRLEKLKTVEERTAELERQAKELRTHVKRIKWVIRSIWVATLGALIANAKSVLHWVGDLLGYGGGGSA